MKCPYCHYLENKVLDTRLIENNTVIRRRRQCEQCAARFTTYEKIKESKLMVIKKNGKKELFDHNKILNGILKACKKRPVSREQIMNLTEHIEKECRKRKTKTILSQEIGKIILEKLRTLDQIAYLRFASVYQEFSDVHTFMQEAKKLKKT